jgi:hypothetical protein
VAKRLICKQLTLLGNGRDTHARNNRTVFYMWSMPRCYNQEVILDSAKRGLDTEAEE